MRGLTDRLLFTAAIATSSAAVVFFLQHMGQGRSRNAGPRSAGLLTGDDVVRPGALPTLGSYNDELAKLAARVMPGVVKISGKRQREEPNVVATPDGEGRPGRLVAEDVVGSGVIIDELGHVVTNWHVVENVDPLLVSMNGGESLREATIIDHDAARDLAVLLIKPVKSNEAFPFLVMGDSDLVRCGHMVMAIGNPLGLSDTITHGIIGHRDRRLADSTEAYLQTSCVINPGNSGGPLINMAGEVAGIVTRKLQGIGERGEGYGLAIPSNDVRDTVTRILGQGKPRPYLGLSVSDWPEHYDPNQGFPEAALVKGVDQRSPAKDAGLMPGDIITGINDAKVTSMAECMRQLRALEVGVEHTIALRRQEIAQRVKVTAEDFAKALPSTGGEQRQVHGLTVRSLSQTERSGLLRLHEAIGLRVEKVARDSPFAGVLEPDMVILDVGSQSHDQMESVTSPEDLAELLTKYQQTGGGMRLARRRETVFQTFPAWR